MFVLKSEIWQKATLITEDSPFGNLPFAHMLQYANLGLNRLYRTSKMHI